MAGRIDELPIDIRKRDGGDERHSDLPRCSHRYNPAQSNILYMYD